MDNAEWLAVLHVAGLIPTLARMDEERLLSEQGFAPVPLVGGILEPEVWEAPAWMDGIGGALFVREAALGIACEFAHAGVEPGGAGEPL